MKELLIWVAVFSLALWIMWKKASAKEKPKKV